MNILVIRTHRLGDVLQLTPMLTGLKRKYPGCRITFLTGADMVELLAGNPDIDEIVSIPEKEFRWYLKNKPEKHTIVHNRMHELISGLQEKKFDLIINRQYEEGSVIAGLAGAGEIHGGVFRPEHGFVFEDVVSQELFNTIRTDRSQNQRNLVDWSCLIAGVPAGCAGMTLYPSEMDRWEAEGLLDEAGAGNPDSLVAVQMGAARSFRQWGVEKYASVVKWLVNEKGRKVVLLGSSDEIDLVQGLQQDLTTENGYIIDLVGKTSLKVLGAVLDSCEYLITGDTGTMHVAAAVGTPVISLFYGTAYPWETGPYGTGNLVLYADEPCAPCLKPETCAFGHKCRKAITSEHVCRAFEIAEKLKENDFDSPGWEEEAVRLFVALARPGHDQVLIPINEVNSMRTEFGSLSPERAKRQLDSKAVLESGLKALIEKGESLIETFHRGDRGEFLEALPGYFDKWGKSVEFLNSKESNYDHVEILRHIAPILNEACRAMEAGDYVTIVDLIHFEFRTILESGIQAIKKEQD
ncbi:MAG: glycosyltransferase family 9 protein [Pseudomonadota bacterium]